MKKIYLWGAGACADYVYNKILKQNCEILGMIDSNIEKQCREWKYGVNVFSPEYLTAASFDYILITPKEYQGIYDKCMEMEISEEKILVYWNDEERQGIIDNRSVYIKQLETECERYKYRVANFPYEYGLEKTPVIKSGVELLKYILETKVSLCRYGDGEFDLMLEKERPWFQTVDKRLAERLREIITA